MLKVLFIDDEPFIREGMASVIDWEKYGYQVIGSAENGKIGLQKIRAYRPDLVFVDIQMPGLSGIEVVSQANKEGISSKFVVLSGHSDFSYAQQSIRLGMESYLLKPVDEEELIPLIQQIRMKWLKENQLNEQLQEFKELNEASQWENFLFGKKVDSDWSSYFQADSFHLASLMTNEEAMLEKHMPFIAKKVYRYIWNEHKLYLLFRNQTLEEVKQSIIAISHDLAYIAHQFQLLEGACGIDKLKDNIEQLSRLEALRYSHSKAIILTDQDVEKISKTGFNRDEWLNTMTRTIEFQDEKAIERHIQLLEKHFQATRFSKDRMITEVLDMVKSLYQKLQYENKDIQIPSNEHVISIISSADNLQALLSNIKELLWTTSTEMNAFISNTENIIEKVQDYVEQYYYKDLNMKKMAHLFKYNPSYLGKKFKKETGEYFYHYLDRIRTEKAKKFLMEGNWKVYQVSEKVGYTNHDYFYKKFKKNVGVSPKEFQKTYRKAFK
ncbi:response regulator transcription factor [Gracilibacillus timonensis]|uniref:response regulator transcription factor n=1 Tax=Gracilibacillus timonensis TaxID=1816696 RepID=UPI0008243B4A|nr:response regulator [Gracilibacillus timonensis]